MVFNLTNPHLVSSLSLISKTQIYLHFLRCSKSLANLLMLESLIIEACKKLKRTKISEDTAH